MLSEKLPQDLWDGANLSWLLVHAAKDYRQFFEETHQKANEIYLRMSEAQQRAPVYQPEAASITDLSMMQ